ncbi:hypothetical protein LguiA_021799 [Lonicera macranthoides]
MCDLGDFWSSTQAIILCSSNYSVHLVIRVEAVGQVRVLLRVSSDALMGLVIVFSCMEVVYLVEHGDFETIYDNSGL